MKQRTIEQIAAEVDYILDRLMSCRKEIEELVSFTSVVPRSWTPFVLDMVEGCQMSQGKLLAIATKARSRGPMNELDRACVTPEHGITGDFRGKAEQRQVTVLSVEDWYAACSELNQQLVWTTRRANLLVEGIRLANTKDSLLHIGTVVLRITGETEPCGRMDELVAGLRSALTPDWRGGVCCQVVSGGWVEPGAEVILQDASSAG